MDSVTLVLALLLLAEACIAVGATVYIASVTAPVKGQERFLDRLVHRDKRVAFAGAPIVFVIVYSLVRFAVPELGLGPLMAPFGALMIGIPLAVLLWGPIDDAIVIVRERRNG